MVTSVNPTFARLYGTGMGDKFGNNTKLVRFQLNFGYHEVRANSLFLRAMKDDLRPNWRYSAILKIAFFGVSRATKDDLYRTLQ